MSFAAGVEPSGPLHSPVKKSPYCFSRKNRAQGRQSGVLPLQVGAVPLCARFKTSRVCELAPSLWFASGTDCVMSSVVGAVNAAAQSIVVRHAAFTQH